MATPGRPIHDLVTAAVADEPRARDDLLAGLLLMVQRYCRARLGYRETPLGSADDIAQDVCLAVVRALPGYVARHRADPTAGLPDAAAATGGGPEARPLQRELSQQLDGLMRLLSPHQREVLVLRIAVGLTAEETAAATGSTAGAVHVSHHHALNRLRTYIRVELSEGTAPGAAGPGVGRTAPGRTLRTPA